MADGVKQKSAFWRYVFALTVPAAGVAVWETFRHNEQFSFGTTLEGNLLTAGVVFALTFGLQGQLLWSLAKHERSLKAAELESIHMKSRENLAKQLHDGIAQGLFLLSVQADNLAKQLPQRLSDGEAAQTIADMKQTIQHINGDVRAAISTLRDRVAEKANAFELSLQEWVTQISRDAAWDLEWNWTLPIENMDSRAQIELQAIVREIILNAHKHANAHLLIVTSFLNGQGWHVQITDDGADWDPESTLQNPSGGLGLPIVWSRAQAMGWRVALEREKGLTVFQLHGDLM